MQTINTSDTASQLVNKLNQNFSEAGGGIATSNQLKLKMYGGQYANGIPAWTDSLTSTGVFLNYYHSGLIRTSGDVQCALQDGETMSVIGYNNSFAYIGTTSPSAGSSTCSVPTGASYIRIQLYKSSGYTEQRVLSCTFSSGAQLVKDCHAKETMYKFTFEVNVNPDKQEPTSTTDYGGINERHYDLGMVYLPTNYDPDGEPVPLILYCHGTNGYKWGDYPNFGPQLQWDKYHKFCCYNGYAIADCSGMTDKYSIPASGNTGNPDGAKFAMGNPLLINCIIQMYEYLVEVYNFRRDGVFAIARSTGGKTAFLLPYVAPFKVRAVAGLAPGISVINSCRHCQLEELRFVLRRYGYENPQVINSMGTGGNGVNTTAGSEPTQVKYVLDNIHNFDGWDALFAGTSLDVDTMARMMWAHDYIADESTYADVLAVAEDTPKYGMAPSKIWVSADDVNTPLWHLKMFQKMAKKGNCICHIRLLPSGLGQDTSGHNAHYSMDLHANAPKCNYKTMYKGTQEITIGYAETIDWFNQW